MNDQLYSVLKLDCVADGKYIIEIQINPHHDIFKGHFPDRPILPGVCMLEMVRSLVSDISGFSRSLVRADTIKYAAIVDPTVDPIVTVELSVGNSEEGVFSVRASLLKAEKVFMKFKGAFA